MAELLQTVPRPMTGGELQAVFSAERAGSPFLVYRNDRDELRILDLANGDDRCTIGRRHSNDVTLPWDWQVSRVHAELERIGSCWAVADDGLSTNGTFVNGCRISARRRLRDGDMIRVGSSVLVFREPSQQSDTGSLETAPCELPMAPEHLSPSQRRVLIALCRPFKHGDRFGAPATNQEIAAELFLSVDRVKTHLRILFDKFGVAHLPQNKKRLELVERAFLSGVVSASDL